MNWGQIYRRYSPDAAALPAAVQVWMPRPPRHIAQLTALTQRGGVTESRLVEIIQRDSELTSQTLRLVNSCAIGLKSRVRSVSKAVGLLGARRTRMMILSAMLQSSLRLTEVDAQRQERFLGECLERAIFAQAAAAALGVDAECAYVGGLLQDLLLPHLQQAFAADYAGYDPQAARLVEYELQTFGWHHAAAAAHVLKAWNVPEDVVCCVLLSHSPTEVLADRELRHSPVLPVLAGSLLLDSLLQEPGGVLELTRLQESLPALNFLELAVTVDEDIEPLLSPLSDRTPLCDRLAREAVAALEQRRIDVAWKHQRIGNYILEEELGQGAMGVVYRARHATLPRTAAIKLMKGSHLDPVALERFETEAQLTSALESPHTVRILDYGTTPQGVLYYVMEHLRGMSLDSLVARCGPLPERRTIAILRQVCHSLAEAHARGLIHRDIKPDNIFLTLDPEHGDRAKVLDFGLVKSVQPGNGTDSGSKTVCGTPLYLAPEAILRPDQIDGRADLYALGLVAYYLLAGVTAFSGSDARRVLLAQISLDPERPSRRTNRTFTPELEELILRCLKKNPDERPQSVAEFAAQLALLARGDEWTADEARAWWRQVGESRIGGLRRASGNGVADSSRLAAEPLAKTLIEPEPLVPAAASTTPMTCDVAG